MKKQRKIKLLQRSRKRFNNALLNKDNNNVL